MNEKISKSYTMCIQMVTQVFAELWKHNHHANFLLRNKKIHTENGYQFHYHCSFFFSACMQEILQYDYSLTYNYSWIFLGVRLFLDIPGYSRIFLGVQLFLRSCADQEEENQQILVLWVYFCMVYFLYF